MILSVLSVLLNMVLDPLFIFTFQWGIRGVGARYLLSTTHLYFHSFYGYLPSPGGYFSRFRAYNLRHVYGYGTTLGTSNPYDTTIQTFYRLGVQRHLVRHDSQQCYYLCFWLLALFEWRLATASVSLKKHCVTVINEKDGHGNPPLQNTISFLPYLSRILKNKSIKTTRLAGSLFSPIRAWYTLKP